MVFFLLCVCTSGFGQVITSTRYEDAPKGALPAVAEDASLSLTKLPLTLNLHFQSPVLLPNDELELIDSATDFGAAFESW